MKNKRTSIAIITICAIAIAGGSAHAEKWSFGVMGDTQWYRDDPTGKNINSVAVNQIEACNQNFVKANVKFVVQVGDLCNNFSDDAFQTRLDANHALNAAKIPFYGLRGNHERPEAAKTFFQNHYLPKNSPDGGVIVTVAPDKISYTVTYKNIKIVLLDINTARRDDTVNWMSNQLSTNDRDHAFVFQHVNLLSQGRKENLFGPDNEANPTLQNQFLSILHNNRVRYNISGHDHMHHRSHIISPDQKSTITQLICASVSSRYHTPNAPYSDRETPIAQQLNMIGHYIFTIDGPLVTIDHYATPHQRNGDVFPNPTWTLVETFGYSTNGKQFLIPQKANFNAVKDTSPFPTATRMALTGTNESTLTVGNPQKVQRPVTKAVNTGWAPRTADTISDILTIWGMQDITPSQLTDGIAIPNTPTSLPFTLTMSYDASKYTNPYIQQQSRNGTWLPLKNSTSNPDNTISATVSPTDTAIFSIGGTAR